MFRGVGSAYNRVTKLTYVLVLGLLPTLNGYIVPSLHKSQFLIKENKNKKKYEKGGGRGGNEGFIIVFCTPHNPFDNQSLSLVPLDPSNDQGPRPSTCRMTYQSHNIRHSTYEYMSTSYHHEPSVQDAQSSVHPPLQPFLEVTKYQARMSRVFAGYSTASGLTFRPLLILSSLLCLKHI